MDRIKGWSDVVNEIVGAQLRVIDNPDFVIPLIRRIKTDEIIKNKKIKPKRNKLCLCGSLKKYKKCCGSA